MSKDVLKLALEFANDIRLGRYKGDAEEISTAIKQALEQPVQESLSFNCSAGCGACGVKLQDFVTHQTQSQEGDEWVVVGTQPQIVSTCCGSPVDVWDKRKQDITASVEATPPAAAVHQTCNCRWDGEVQVQQCTLHQAHVDAIHEWAERAKAAEAKLAAQPAPAQEPVAMRMPKVGDKVVCIDDESLGTVVYLTAGGSPEIKFDDGSHGTYMLREFAELFGYTTPPTAQPAPVQDEHQAFINSLPTDSDDKMYMQIHHWARQSYKHHQSLVRGQMITAADASDTHIIWAALRWAKENTPPAAQPAPVQPVASMSDEQDAFEKVFKLPDGITRFDGGYAPTSYSAWSAQQNCYRWEGWKARSKLCATPPAQEIVCSTGLCHYKPAAQRPWVGLTNAEMLKLQAEASVRHHRNTERMRGKQHSSEDEYLSIYARAIEAKIKEKNT
jgi:hypothetical protein